MVSHKFPLPEEVRSLGQAVQLAYYQMRKDLIENHNQEVTQRNEEELDLVWDLTRGHPSIECSECGEEVAWGNIRVHRRGGQGGCKQSIVNFSDSE